MEFIKLEDIISTLEERIQGKSMKLKTTEENGKKKKKKRKNKKEKEDPLTYVDFTMNWKDIQDLYKIGTRYKTRKTKMEKKWKSDVEKLDAWTAYKLCQISKKRMMDYFNFKDTKRRKNFYSLNKFVPICK